METFTEPKPLERNPRYSAQRRRTLAGLSDDMIDRPLVGLVRDFNRLPCCYTLQCCYGHFVYPGQEDPHNLEPLPRTDAIHKVEYRIAYVAVCVQTSDSGKRLLDAMRKIPTIDPENIQLCCAGWFWERHVNSYALQVEPDRFKSLDQAVLEYEEALKIEKVRNELFRELRAFLKKQRLSTGLD